MKLFISAVLALSSFAAAPTIGLAAAQVAVTCSADVPEAMKRPGGYCDIIQSTDNIGTERNKGSTPPCIMPTDYQQLRHGITVLVAGVLCCNRDGEATMPTDLPAGLLSRTDAIEVAQIDPCYE